jgi:hypothetical protein
MTSSASIKARFVSVLIVALAIIAPTAGASVNLPANAVSGPSVGDLDW